MNQIEIVKAILAGEVLDVKLRSTAEWCVFTAASTPTEDNLEHYIDHFEHIYKYAEFRIKPKVKTYQSRAYIDNEGNIFHWVSTNSMSQDDAINAHGYWARWIEETQTKEYV